MSYTCIASIYPERKWPLWHLIRTLHQWRHRQNSPSAHKHWQGCQIWMYPGSKWYKIAATRRSIRLRIHRHGLRDTLASPVVIPLRRRELDAITIELVRIRGRRYQEIRTNKKLARCLKIDIHRVVIACSIRKLE